MSVQRRDGFVALGLPNKISFIGQLSEMKMACGWTNQRAAGDT